VLKRLTILLVAAGIGLYAQEHGAAKAETEGHEAASHESGDPLLPAKWLNFAILAGGIGFLAIKLGGPALKAQQKGILDDMSQAARRAEATAAQAAEIEKKIGNLEGEVAGIRAKASEELASESERLKQETAQMIAKVEQAAAQEIASAGKFAQHDLKAHAAQLALELAEQKVRARMDGATQAALVDRFIGDLPAGTRN